MKRVGSIEETRYDMAFRILEDFGCKDDGSLFSTLLACSGVLRSSHVWEKES
jgi:hypothetical protein